jgi:hypothetical protein
MLYKTGGATERDRRAKRVAGETSDFLRFIALVIHHRAVTVLHLAIVYRRGEFSREQR